MKDRGLDESAPLFAELVSAEAERRALRAGLPPWPWLRQILEATPEAVRSRLRGDRTAAPEACHRVRDEIFEPPAPLLPGLVLVMPPAGDPPAP